MTTSLRHRSALLNQLLFLIVTPCLTISASTAADISKEKIIAVKAAHMLDSSIGS